MPDLRAARERLELLQPQMAELLGMRERTYRRWEVEGPPEGLETLAELALHTVFWRRGLTLDAVPPPKGYHTQADDAGGS